MKFGQLRRRVEIRRWEVEHPELQMYYERTGCAAPAGVCIAFIVLMLVCCKTNEKIVKEVEYVTTDRVVYRDSLVQVPVPYEVETRYCPFIDTIHLQTSLASASVWLDWNKEMLIGTIKNKPTHLDTHVTIPTRYITKKVNCKTTITVTKKINRLYWWQKCLMWYGGLTSLVVLLWICWWLARRFRHRH